MFLSATVALAATLPLVYGAPVQPDNHKPGPFPYAPGLNTLARADGKLYYGTASDNNNRTEWTDQKYLAVLDHPGLWGQVTPANTMKWMFTEPERNVFNYTGGDELVNRARRNGQLVRCHNLVWHNQLPEWLTSGTWDNKTLLSIMENRINHDVAHFKDACYAWDVVNEALNDDGTYRESIFYNVTGPQYIPLAFKFAQNAIRAAGRPNIKLYYNDYNIETPGAKSTAAQNIVKEIQAQGIKIDGVGLQSHFIVGNSPSEATQVENMQAFTKLGVDVAVTELDVRFETLPYNASGQAQQALDYGNATAACLSVKRCVGLTIWDFDDKYSWIPSTFAGQGGADPWDADTNVKPVVYQGIVNALTRRQRS